MTGIASLALLAALAGAPVPSARSIRIDLAAVPKSQLYRPGGIGYEPGRTEAGYQFSVAVPEGTYRVTLGFAGGARTTVKAESRRLMLAAVRTRGGETASRSFLVAVRTPALPPLSTGAPGGTAVRISAGETQSLDWDDRLTLEVLGTASVTTIAIASATAPTIYLAGDSTVADQPNEPFASWGQMLPTLLDDGIAVANHAWSGETLKSFVTGLRLDKLLELARPGDWLLIQFGHNDQKTHWPQTYADPATTYPAYLRVFIAEARRRGMTPVLVTPPQRRIFDAVGRITGTLDAYADAMKAVAASDRVPLIDLNAATRTIYETLGPTQAAQVFGDEGRDRTHNDNAGAWLLANVVAAGLARAVPDLAAHIDASARAFDPAHPPSPATIAVPPSLAHGAIGPSGN